MSLAVVICIETSDVRRDKVKSIVDSQNTDYSIEGQTASGQVVELLEPVCCNKHDELLLDWNSVI